MAKKISYYLFSIFALLCLCGISVFIFFVKDPLEVSPQENRKLVSPSHLQGSDFLSGSFQKTIEDILTDQFLYRIELVNAKKKMDYKLTQMLQSERALKAEAENRLRDALLKPMSQGRYQVGNSDYLVYYPIQGKEELKQRILDRIWQMNHLAELYPNTSFYIYRPLQAQELPFFDEANQINSSGYHYNTMAQASAKIPFKMFEMKDLEEYKKYFFASDHHWNYLGSYLGYTQILEMLQPEAEPLLPQDKQCLPENYPFYGTHANATGRILPGDIFCAYTFDFADISAKNFETGESISLRNVNDFLANYQQAENDYYYNEAYSTFGERTHFYNPKGKGSLLLVGDSYSAPIVQLLASHYQDLYLLRCQEKFETFDYISFLDTHSIDQVLFMYTIEYYEFPGAYEPYEITFREEAK